MADVDKACRVLLDAYAAAKDWQASPWSVRNPSDQSAWKTAMEDMFNTLGIPVDRPSTTGLDPLRRIPR